MAMTGDYDLVCCGHTHKTKLEEIQNIKGKMTIFCNAGTVGGIAAIPSYIYAFHRYTGNSTTLYRTLVMQFWRQFPGEARGFHLRLKKPPFTGASIKSFACANPIN